MRIKEWQYEKFGLSREFVRETVETVLRHADPSRIILYGSRSRGDFAERSDIDLAVEGVSHPGLLRGYLEEEVRTLRRFDVIDLDRTTSTMRESVERDESFYMRKGIHHHENFERALRRLEPGLV